jgi:hypothetical protein
MRAPLVALATVPSLVLALVLAGACGSGSATTSTGGSAGAPPIGGGAGEGGNGEDVGNDPDAGAWEDDGGAPPEEPPGEPEPAATCAPETTACQGTDAAMGIASHCSEFAELDTEEIYVRPGGDDLDDCSTYETACRSLWGANARVADLQKSPSSNGAIGHHVVVHVCDDPGRFWHSWVKWSATDPSMKVIIQGTDCDGVGGFTQPVFDGCKEDGTDCNLHSAIIVSSPGRTNVTIENLTFQRYQNPIELKRFTLFDKNEPLPPPNECNQVLCNTFRKNGTRHTKQASSDDTCITVDGEEVCQGPQFHNFTTGLIDMLNTSFNLVYQNVFRNNDIVLGFGAGSRGHTHSVYAKFGSSYNCFQENQIINTTSNFHLRHNCHFNAFVRNVIQGSGHSAIVDEWNHHPAWPSDLSGLPECSSCQNLVKGTEMDGTFGCTDPIQVSSKEADLQADMSPGQTGYEFRKRCSETCTEHTGDGTGRWILFNNTLTDPGSGCGYLNAIGADGY